MKKYCNSCYFKKDCMRYSNRKLYDPACEKYIEDWSDIL